MAITIDAVYEDGVLKPAGPLPLAEKERVRVSVHRPADIQQALQAAERAYGRVKWSGDPEVLRRIAEDDEFGILESP